MSEWKLETDGDNIEFTAVDIDTYTIFLQHNSNTSANDTATKKYPDNTTTARKFSIRVDKNSSLIGVNERTFTDAETIVANKEKTETRNHPIIQKLVIRTTATNTKIKVKWF